MLRHRLSFIQSRSFHTGLAAIGFEVAAASRIVWRFTNCPTMAQTAAQQDDEALVSAMRGGDDSALRTFYDRHSPVVYAICHRVLNNATDAEELLIDIFFEFWRRVDSFDARRGTPVAMLVTLARSRAIDRRRGRPTMRMVSLEMVTPTAASTHDAVAHDDEKAKLRSALAELSDEQRAAIESCYYEGLSHSEIATRLRKPLGTVKTWIRQGLSRLHKAMARPVQRRGAP